MTNDKCLIVLCVALLFSGCTHHLAPSPFPQAQTLTKTPNARGPDMKPLKESIKQTISDNPELLYNSVKGYAAEKRLEAEIISRFQESLRNRVKGAVTENNPSKGPLNAPITIIEYTDFQCATCAQMAKVMDEILGLYPKTVRLVFKNNPLESHDRALPAAKAALAAGRQGKFWEYHDLFFDSMLALHERKLVEHAENLGLDVKKFKRDRNSTEISKQIKAEQTSAREHGFTQPPAFIINGVVMNGANPPKYFTTIIDHLLAEEGDIDH